MDGDQRPITLSLGSELAETANPRKKRKTANFRSMKDPPGDLPAPTEGEEQGEEDPPQTPQIVAAMATHLQEVHPEEDPLEEAHQMEIQKTQ